MDRPVPAVGGRVQPPPGTGWPILQRARDLREFRRSWLRFFQRRRDSYGSTVFRTWILHPTVMVMDPEGFQVLFDTEAVRKRHGFGPAIPRASLVGGITPTVFQNGVEHDLQKGLLLRLIQGAIPRLEPAVKRALAPRLERWSAANTPFDWGLEGEGLLGHLLFDWLLGASPDPADLKAWFSPIFSPFPANFPLPRTPASALAARDRLLRCIQESPGFHAVADEARAEVGWSESETARHLLFLLGFSAWAGLQATWQSLMGELSNHPDVVEGLRAEARSVGDPPGGMLSVLRRTPLLQGCILETLRLHGPVPFAYGEARKDLVIRSSTGSYSVRKGEVIQGSFWMVGRDPRHFPDPARFDPRRYEVPGAAAHVLWANGPGDTSPGPRDKVCAGQDVVLLLLGLLTLELVRGWRWTLAEPARWSEEEAVRGNVPVAPVMVTSFTREA